jgi:DNA-binding transcriptional ArsR family regulator
MCAARSAHAAPGPELIERIAVVLKAIADPVRLNILYHLQSGDMCVGDLVVRIGCSQANVSKHLAILKQTGLVSAHSKGTVHYYSVADPMVGAVCDTVCTAVENRMADDRRLLKRRGN